MLSFDQLEGRPILTEREHQILELVAIGLSAKEVAQQILIAPRTVERHIENIRLKMRARNRTHMVTCAAMSGLLSADKAETKAVVIDMTAQDDHQLAVMPSAPALQPYVWHHHKAA
jgi:LuxR family transcriptional regulator, transcriptional regulator of spore coat protein